jgi:hypothetical protein
MSLRENFTIDNLGIHAGANGFGTCRGRFLIAGGKQFSKGETDRDVDLPAYLDKLAKSAALPSQWPSFNHTGLYPRRDAGYLFLGEDCREKRHFDCEGFIAWVLWSALAKDPGTWRKGVPWYNDGGGGRLKVFSKSAGNFPLKSSLQDGDILIKLTTKHEHIGFASAGGKFVVHASGRSRGVLTSAFDASRWTAMARIRDEHL